MPAKFEVVKPETEPLFLSWFLFHRQPDRTLKTCGYELLFIVPISYFIAHKNASSSASLSSSTARAFEPSNDPTIPAISSSSTMRAARE
jgi:hypothetical protein